MLLKRLHHGMHVIFALTEYSKDLRYIYITVLTVQGDSLVKGRHYYIGRNVLPRNSTSGGGGRRRAGGLLAGERGGPAGEPGAWSGNWESREPGGRLGGHGGWAYNWKTSEADVRSVSLGQGASRLDKLQQAWTRFKRVGAGQQALM